MPTNGYFDCVNGSETSIRVAPSAATIARDGLWGRNAGLVQLLGLCPLLAVSNQVGTALGLALATTSVLVLSNAAVSLLRHLVTRETRIACFVVVIAGAVTVIELTLRAWAHELYGALGIFLPLIVTNCAILARAETFAARNPPGLAMLDGLATGLGFGAVLVLLGAVRELIGSGTLFSGLGLLWGAAGDAVEITVNDGGLLIALLPPGAFIILGFLVAAHRWLQDRRPASPVTEPRPAAS